MVKDRVYNPNNFGLSTLDEIAYIPKKARGSENPPTFYYKPISVNKMLEVQGVIDKSKDEKELVPVFIGLIESQCTKVENISEEIIKNVGENMTIQFLIELGGAIVRGIDEEEQEALVS